MLRSSRFLIVLCLLVVIAALPAVAANARVTVVFKGATLPANAAALIAAAGGTLDSSIPQLGVAVAVGPASMLDALNSNSAVLAASPTLTVTLNDRAVEASVPEFNTGTADLYNLYQWDIKKMTNNGASFELSTGSHNTVVGIIDTGVSQNHSALKANLLGGRNFTPDGPGGSVVATDIEDRNGHGSHVAGSIAGNGRILGIAPNLGFRMYRVFGATGGAPTTRIVSAMIAATDDGVDIISMSIGGFDGIAVYTWTDPDTGIVYKGKDVADFLTWRRAVQYANQHGIAVVAAAGNEGTDIGNPKAVSLLLNALYGADGYNFQGASREVSGTIAGVLTVAATGPDGSLASYSNYGPGAIDISAPGGDALRYPVGDWYTDMCLSSYKGTGYVWMDGTSMATPKTAAVGALIIDQAKAQGIRLTPQQVVTRIQQTALGQGTSPYFGHGMASAFNALSQ